IALESDWRKAQRDGAYTTSTLGRSLEEEGFIHASRAEQVKGVNDRTFRGVRKPLVRLDIDTDKLEPKWREDPVEGGDSYPHIYGPLNLDAVTAVRPWHRSGREKQFVEVFLSEALFRISLAILVMLLAFLGSYVGRSYDSEWGPFVGAVIGLVVGGALFALTMSKRR
ncbi:MAG TPA: DUF952 domain-containing protein, partial [Kribbellaceae bacterium]|nr:DUF952 domain-containing protein [Kribbellaceae bacterium]